MDFKLRVDRRRWYAPNAGLFTGFTQYPFQLLEGDKDSKLLYINQPVVGLSGPSPQMLSVGFNSGVPIQRAVSRDVITVVDSGAIGFHVRIVCFIPSMSDGILWTQSTPYSADKSTLGPRLSFKYEAPYGWVFVYEVWSGTPDAPSLLFNMHSGYLGYNYPNPGWYDVIVSISRANYGDSAQLRVNGPVVASKNGSLFTNAASGPWRTGTAYSIADTESYDGVYGLTEGVKRFVGKVSYFSTFIGALHTSDTSTTVMSDDMANKLYGAVMAWSPPVQRGYADFHNRVVSRLPQRQNSLKVSYFPGFSKGVL